jgi:hypothetical protein
LKKVIIIISILLFLFLGLIVSYSILKRSNKYVKEWDSYPIEQKKLNIKLFLEKPIYWIFKHEVSLNETYITKEKLIESITLGADWILSMQEETGRYNYWYNPKLNKYSSKYDDNFLRQAGTGYSLLLVYEQLREEKYLISALKNLEYLFQFKQNIDSVGSFFLYKQKAKLGGIALPMLTMLKYRELTNDTIYDEDLKNFTETVIYLQSYYKSGKFKSTYIYRGDYNYEETSGWESSIYPGEAMLALTFMYKQFKDERYLKSLNDAFYYYSKKGRWMKSSFIPWTASAFSELYTIEPEKKYAKFVYKMCNYTLHQQNLNANRITYGSFGSAPTVFTSTSFEGIGDAIQVARLINDKERERKYTERSLIAYNWLFKLQYIENDSVPEQAIGGFRRSLHQPEIRIDNTQHAISAMCRGLKYIYKSDN